MINTLSKLSSIASKAENSSLNLRFNSSLPITITVLESMTLDRYKLLLGNREFTTKSQKKLEKGAKYWGNFGENKDGIITISGLIKKPSFFQDSSLFLDFELNTILQEIKSLDYPSRFYKNWILENLATKGIDKNTFRALTQMLMALNEQIFHLPMKSGDKPLLMQFSSVINKRVDFYIAYENLGPLRGYILNGTANKTVSMDVLYEKSFYFLKKEFEKLDIISYMNIDKNIKPLYDTDKLMLDIKG